mmetsp:Transcript_46972/g.91681  ORF Transcript_46972/g.91681 Transcript_46972/m.91681 type:complete len:305 (+) Transcript_46972:146-1060(+)
MYLTTAAAILLLTHAAYGQDPRCALNPDITGAVVIPAGWTEIPEMAFFSCEALTSIVIPNTITIINDDAFRLTNLVKVEFENGSRLHTIGSSAFMSTIHMKRIKIPRSVTLIKDSAFKLSGVEDFQFEKDSQLQTIVDFAFKESRFKKIKIPKSVKLIMHEAFLGSKIEEVEFENGSQLKEIRSKAFESTQLVTINIPAGVRVGADVFEDTPCLKKSIFKPGVKIVKCKEVRSTFSSKTTKISSSPPSEVTSSPTMHETSPRAVISVRGSTKAKKSTKFKKGKNATKKNKAKKDYRLEGTNLVV